MIDLIREHKPVRRRGLDSRQPTKGLGVVPLIAAVPAAISAVGALIKLFKNTGKNGREQFFDARNKVTEEIARQYQQALGYNYQAMIDYYWKRPNSASPNEKLVIDRWWGELNPLNIGDDGSGDILNVQSISFKSFAPAFDRLDTAFKNYVSKYMSANSQPLPTKAQEQATVQASVPSGSTNTLMAKFQNLSPEGRTVVIGTAATGALFLLIATLKATKVI